MSHVYLKPYQTMMTDWLSEYRLSADEGESSGAEDYAGYTFSEDDFGIQSDLIAKKRIYSMKNSKFVKTHPAADHKLVSDFDPATDKADRWIFDQVVCKPKSPRSKKK
jgi:hypothetical protein